MTESPITVLHLVNSLQWGGVRRHVLDLRRGLAAHGVRSLIAAWLPSGDPRGGDPDVYPLPLYDASGTRKSAAGFFESVRVLRALLRRENVALVHEHSRYAALLGDLATRGRNTARLYTAHNVFEDLRRFPFYPRDILAPSAIVRDHFRAHVRRAGRGRITVVRHGVDIPEMEIRNEETHPRFCFAGRLCEEKGIRVLVEALGLLHAAGGELPEIDILGDGPLRAWMSEQIASTLHGMPIRVHGYVTDPLPRIAGATALLFPSIALDSAPYIVLEALASAVPVIASDLPVLRELVRHGESGWTVPPGDAPALAGALRVAIAEPARMRRMGIAGQSIVRGLHGQDRMCAETAAVYREILRR
ncbi:MAG: glycosyltransferase family 4 protein [Bacteroidota bacterium]|nr:glycosyltransferase family 4 protein [Bacteroidota bacterium]